MEYNYLDLNKVVFDKHWYIGIDHPLNNRDKDIDNWEDWCFRFVDMWINIDKVNWYRN
jgi:hypothetical protein